MAAMDVFETRHKNVRMLVQRMEIEAGRTGGRAGGLAMLAKKLGKEQAQVNHFASEQPIKNIGPKIARQIDKVFGNEPGWLDQPQWETDTPMVAGAITADSRTHNTPVDRVYVMGIAVVNTQGSFEQITEDVDGNGYFVVEVEDKDAYYLRLRGPGSTFIVEPGWYILLAPNSVPQAMEKVVAKLRDGRWLAGTFDRQDGGEYLIRRPDGSLAVLSEDDVEFVHPVHGMMSPRQIRRD